MIGKGGSKPLISVLGVLGWLRRLVLEGLTAIICWVVSSGVLRASRGGEWLVVRGYVVYG